MSIEDPTFLELCQNLARELSIPGSGPTTVVSQDGEHLKIVRYVRMADMDIKNRYIDWKFLWRDDFSTTLSVNQETLDSGSGDWPTNLGTWNPDQFVLDPTSDDYVTLEYTPYREWKRRFGYGTHTADMPGAITIKPDRSLAWFPKADSAYTLTGEYWKAAVPMTANGDISDIPARFRRLILVRAKLYYAELEDAPEISQGAGAEHDDLLDQLIAHEAPGQEVKRHTSAPESRRVVVVPQ